MSESKPWRDEDTLRELYHEKGMTQKEVAEELDIAQKTVSNWMKKLNIEINGHIISKLRDEDWLYEQYIVEEKSIPEIADEIDCSLHTVWVWLEEHGIETKTANYEKAPYFHTTRNGYEEIKTKVDGKAKCVLVHRLLAVAEFGFDEVADMHVHHESGIQWDNRPEKLSLMTNSEHGSHHVSERERDSCGRFA